MTTTQQTFAAFSVPAYRLLWIGLTVNFAALWVSFVVRGYLAFQLTESVTALAGLQLSFGVPMLLFSLYGGMLADRLPRRRVLVVTMAVLSASFAVQAAVVIVDVIEYWMLFATGVVEGVVVAALFPTRMAVMAQLVDEDQVGNAVALGQVSFNLARIVLPTMAGAMIAVELVGVGGTMALVAALYLSAALVYGRLPPMRPDGARGPRVSPLTEIAEGMRYVRREPALMYVIALTLAVTSTLMPYFGFIPAVVDDVFDGGSVKLGLMTSAIAVGALGASFVGARIAQHPGALRARMFAAYGFASAMVAFALAPTYGIALAAGVALGAGEVSFISLNQSLSTRLSAAEYRGRVQSILSLAFAAFGIISLPVGMAADLFGIRETLLVQGLLGLVTISVAELYGRRIRAAESARATFELTARADALEDGLEDVTPI